MQKILNIKNVEEQVHRRFAAGAKLEGISQGEFFKRIMEFWAANHREE